MAKGRRGRRLKFAGAIVAVNMGLLSVAWWVFLRVTDDYIGRQDKARLVYDDHAFRRQVLVPDQKYEHGNVNISINKLGLRGAAPTMPKPDGVQRVFVMGGSSVFDHLLSEGRSWPEMLAKAMFDLGLTGIESFNAGIPGYSSRETLSLYHDKVRYLGPDVVILYQGWNDVKYMRAFRDRVDVDSFFYVKNLSDTNKLFTSPRPVRNWHALTAMIKTWRKSDTPAVQEAAPAKRRARKKLAYMTDSGADIGKLEKDWATTKGIRFFRSNVEAFVQAVLSDGALPVLVAQNTLVTAKSPAKVRKKITYRWIKMNHENLIAVNNAMVEVLREVGRKYEIPVIDLRSEMNGRREFFADHVHLNADGSQALATHVARTLAAEIDLNIKLAELPDSSSRLVGHWTFDEMTGNRVRDVGPRRVHGRAEGGVSQVENGKHMGAFRFDGKSGQVVVDRSEALHLHDRFSVEAWIKVAAAAAARNDSMGLVIKGGEYYLAIHNGRLSFFGYGMEPEKWHAANRPVPVGEWVRVAARYDGTKLELLMNDEPVLVQPMTGTLLAIGSPLTIGGLNGHSCGEIDDVRIEILP